jgi:hydroxyethylthiazole kinase-like uncharacterized protein yjeF
MALRATGERTVFRARRTAQLSPDLSLINRIISGFCEGLLFKLSEHFTKLIKLVLALKKRTLDPPLQLLDLLFRGSLRHTSCSQFALLSCRWDDFCELRQAKYTFAVCHPALKVSAMSVPVPLVKFEPAIAASKSDPVLNVDEVVALEKLIASRGTSLFELMQRAGHSVSRFIIDCVDREQSVAIFCGSGNNGGDGWVIADDLCAHGYSVTLVTAQIAAFIKTEPAKSAAQKTLSFDHRNLHVIIDPSQDQLDSLLSSTTVVVDAILGTGFSGDAVRNPYSTWISAINSKNASHDLMVVAVDVPSGLSAQTGHAADTTLTADVTITMLAYKPGLLLDSAKKYCGKLYLAKIANNIEMGNHSDLH